MFLFLMDSIYIDIVFVVEGKWFYIYCLLLGYVLEYFQKLFVNVYVVLGEKVLRMKLEVVIKDKSYSDFLEFLVFYYLGVIWDFIGICICI